MSRLPPAATWHIASQFADAAGAAAIPAHFAEGRGVEERLGLEMTREMPKRSSHIKHFRVLRVY